MADKLPYIPLYIGDWEQDTNWITLEAEGALLKLIFKLWKAKDKGRLEIGLFQLSILFKKPQEDTMKIMKELQQNQVLDIEFLPDNMLMIESRRMLREKNKSDIFSNNGKKGGRPKSKMKPDDNLIHDNDIDTDNEYESLNENEPEKLNGKSVLNNKKNKVVSIFQNSYLSSDYNLSSALVAEWDKIDFINIDPECIEDFLKFLQFRTTTKKKPVVSAQGANGLLNPIRGVKAAQVKKMIEKAINNEWQRFAFNDGEKDQKNKWQNSFEKIK